MLINLRRLLLLGRGEFRTACVTHALAYIRRGAPNCLLEFGAGDRPFGGGPRRNRGGLTCDEYDRRARQAADFIKLFCLPGEHSRHPRPFRSVALPPPAALVETD
ncbi:hypothetical protein [Mesorhizobium sp.]|uniref:hypothetical protein n=1 Tax=Mesorhizobium sp. TaxID=1871066 RepID=UPI000FE6FE58|nr:hypothetical protein [Mesorhizobium sp.]RWB69991.1 MAG: hypothetical protein EOQ49_19240 [Mesorhizobium sp.]